ncbi:hypothetical protein C2S52_014958 [Perilla frutescens var. hirtella]|nr:hypothetical protein C2S52_014958 [Perilla frutescens var. hirtella]KAH6816220.1 hypothetical protein C2S51_021040 [Perilla frutescens var. frutescens]
MAKNFVVFLPLLIFCFVFPPPASSYSSNQTDRISLLAIKSSLEDPQGALMSWNQTLHFCSWNGIQCGGRNRDRVVTINLTSQGLVGNLSPHVGNLSFLTTIILKNNTFNGPIPTEISHLRRLEFVDFNNNSFVGEIPMNLSRCPNLVRLNLVRNFLSGAIPTDLGFLSKLETLALSANKLSGPIPPSIGNITTLTKLSLGSCNFNGEIPESFGRLRRLTSLQLYGNSLTGIIPPSLFNLSDMQFFDVSVNQLHGLISSTVGLTLPNLACLYVEQNQFSGRIPNSISNASLIEWLDMSSNQFTGPIPSVGGLTQIQEFILHSNLIVDDLSFISSLTNSTELERLDVSDNMLSGSLPESTTNLSIHLSWLYIHKNKIHGNIALGIGDLINLVEVNLSDNFLDGPIPFVIAKLSNLRTLLLGNNRFRGELPSLFGNMTVLSRLHVDGNSLSGNVPTSLGNCTNLLELDLSDNNFNGLIPPEVIRLPSIAIVFNLSHNAFLGSIPYEVGSLKNLAALDLSSNRLSGQIPNSLSRCVSLQQIYLDDNLLDGEIPSALSALMGLQDLDLSRNNLSGLIPAFLGNLKLEKLNLSFNRLHGEVPTTGVFRNITSISLDGNQGLCGGISELKLHHCSGVDSPMRKLSTLLKILIPILVVGGIFVMLLVFCKYKGRMGNQTSFVTSHDSIGGQFMRLSYADLLKATCGFSESNLVGFGRFGSVYKAILNDEDTLFVAVKVLNLAVKGASKTFMAECKALGGIKHRNLVKLVSVCDSIDFQGNNFKALVYEFKFNGSLEKWLYNNKEKTDKSGEEIRNLSIIQRLNIATDIAQGIEYLHYGTGSSIVHGDLKPSNILLDHDMVACVGDFGLAKILSSSHEISNSSIGIKGTLGYVPPEYGTCESVSIQGDVYSYGIILLEMFTNKKPTDDLFDDHLNLHSFVSMALPDGVMEIVDPYLEIGELNSGKKRECMSRILSVGVSCSNENPKDRMPIVDAVNELSTIRNWFCS